MLHEAYSVNTQKHLSVFALIQKAMIYTIV